MKIGTLRHRIVIEQYNTTSDGQGGVTRAWATFATRWGGIEPIKGVEQFRQDQKRPRQLFKVNLRYLEGLTQNMRIVHDNVIYYIISIENQELRDRDMILIVSNREEVN
jgi:SPP1 family predicted phage head-tail adaptor